MIDAGDCLGLLCAEGGCGNAVLRIYSNKSTTPTHELCGISDKQIVTAGNSVRFKCVHSLRLTLSLRFRCVLFQS